MFLLFQSSFRLSEKNEKDKKRKELTPVSATPTHMLRICVNPRPTHKAQAQPTDKTKDMLSIPSAHLPNPRPRHPFFSGRADNACTNLLGFLVRYVRTRGSMRLRRAAKSPTFTLSFITRTCHALLLATNSCTPHEVWKEDGASPPC